MRERLAAAKAEMERRQAEAVRAAEKEIADLDATAEKYERRSWDELPGRWRRPANERDAAAVAAYLRKAADTLRSALIARGRTDADSSARWEQVAHLFIKVAEAVIAGDTSAAMSLEERAEAARRVARARDPRPAPEGEKQEPDTGTTGEPQATPPVSKSPAGESAPPDASSSGDVDRRDATGDPEQEKRHSAVKRSMDRSRRCTQLAASATQAGNTDAARLYKKAASEYDDAAWAFDAGESGEGNRLTRIAYHRMGAAHSLEKAADRQAAATQQAVCGNEEPAALLQRSAAYAYRVAEARLQCANAFESGNEDCAWRLSGSAILLQFAGDDLQSAADCLSRGDQEGAAKHLTSAEGHAQAAETPRRN